MLPQEPSDSYTWDDSNFADWLQTSPERIPRNTQSSRGLRIADLLSSPGPSRPTASLTSGNCITPDLADGLNGGLCRSPRTDDLVALCRRNSIVGRDELDKGKAREVLIMENKCRLAANPFYEKCPAQLRRGESGTQAQNLESRKYDFSDQLIETSPTNGHIVARESADGHYLLSPAQSYTNLLSPTWGRTRYASSSSDLNYDHMEIEELMQDMDVYSDTEYEPSEDISDFARTLFGGSHFPGINSSKARHLSAGEKRKASPGLDMPDLKKQRRIPNPLNCENRRPSSSQPLFEKGAGSPCLGEQVLKSQYIANPLKRERIVSLAHPLAETEHTLYGYN